MIPCFPTSQSSASLAFSNEWRRDTSTSSLGTSSRDTGLKRSSLKALHITQIHKPNLYRAYLRMLSSEMGAKQPIHPRSAFSLPLSSCNVTKMPLRFTPHFEYPLFQSRIEFGLGCRHSDKSANNDVKTVHHHLSLHYGHD